MVSPRSKGRNALDPIPELPTLARKRQSLSADLEYWRKCDDVVMPENRFQSRQVGFWKIRARIHWPIVHAANFQRKRIRLRRYKKICAQTPEFFRQPVTHIQRNAQRCGNHSHAQSQRRSGEELMARTPSKRVGNDSQKHGMSGRRRGTRRGGRSYCGISFAAFLKDEISITKSPPSTCDGTPRGLHPPCAPI